MKSALLITLLLLGGCATIRDYMVDAKVPQHVAEVIDEYCLIPQSERAINRTAVNDLTSRGDVAVTCVGDQ